MKDILTECNFHVDSLSPSNLSHLSQKLRSICMCSQGIPSHVVTEETSYPMFFYSGFWGDLQAGLEILSHL